MTDLTKLSNAELCNIQDDILRRLAPILEAEAADYLIEAARRLRDCEAKVAPRSEEVYRDRIATAFGNNYADNLHDLSTKYLVHTLGATAETLEEQGFTAAPDEMREAANRLDAMRWRDAGEVPDDDQVGLAMACVVRIGDMVMVDTGWFDGDEWRIAGPMPFELIAWMPLPAYEPEGE